MDRWEYKQDILDFHRYRIERKGRQVTVSSIRFSYFNFPNNNTLARERAKGDAIIEKIVLDHASRLGADGWELMQFHVATSDGTNYPLWVLVLMGATVILLPVAFLIGFTIPIDYFRYDYATLSLRRRR